MNKIFNLKTLIALLGLIIPIILFVKSQKIKELSFKSIALTELVSEKDLKEESAIKVYFDEAQILNLYSVSCILTNSGNVPVTKSDYTNEFIIHFPDSVQILKSSIKTTPMGVQILHTSTCKNEFHIIPDLLNQNESVEFSFYISSPNQDLLPITKSRIIGGNILNLKMEEDIKSKTDFKNAIFYKFEGIIFWIAFIYTILYLILFFYAIYIQQETGLETALGKFFAFLFCSIGIICTLFYLIQTRF